MSLDPAKRPVIFGEVLFDRFPDGSVVLGGAPFNVAWHLQAFGQAPLFISRVGNDPLGRQVRDTMRDWGMDSGGLQLDPAHPTGTVEVRFEAGEPHYDIVDQRAYDFVDADALPPLTGAALIYHGTLALRGQASRDAFGKLTGRLSAPRFLDVNLRAPWWDKDAVLSLIGDSVWLKLNGHELAALTPDGTGNSEAGTALCRRCGLRALILTHGARGAQLLGTGTPLSVAPEPARQLVDTVGAGDAFAAVTLLGILRGWSWKATLERAQAFAAAIVGVRGATLQDASFYARFSDAWGLSGT
jgi:fructokinase